MTSPALRPAALVLALSLLAPLLAAGPARADEAEALEARIESQRARIQEIEALLRERPDLEEARAMLEEIKANLRALEVKRAEADAFRRRAAEMEAEMERAAKRRAELQRRQAELEERKRQLEARLGGSTEEIREAIRERTETSPEALRQRAELNALRQRATVLEQAGRAQVERMEAEAATLRSALAVSLTRGEAEKVEELKQRLSRLQQLQSTSKASLLRLEKARMLLSTGRPEDAVAAKRHLKEAVLRLESGRGTTSPVADAPLRRRPVRDLAPATRRTDDRREGGPPEKVRHLREAARHLHAAGMHELSERIRREAQELEGRMQRAVETERTHRLLQALQNEVKALRKEVRELRNVVRSRDENSR